MNRLPPGSLPILFHPSAWRNCLESLRHEPDASPSVESWPCTRTLPRSRTGARSPCSSLLFWPSQEKVLSTTHLRGKATYPRGGISLCQSTFLPSLAHSCAQICATFSGIGFGGLGACAPPPRSTLELPRPIVCPCPRSRRRARGVSSVRVQPAPTEAAALTRPGLGPLRCAP